MTPVIQIDPPEPDYAEEAIRDSFTSIRDIAIRGDQGINTKAYRECVKRIQSHLADILETLGDEEEVP